MRRLLLLALLGTALALPATAQQFPEPVLYECRRPDGEWVKGVCTH